MGLVLLNLAMRLALFYGLLRLVGYLRARGWVRGAHLVVWSVVGYFAVRLGWSLVMARPMLEQFPDFYGTLAMALPSMLLPPAIWLGAAYAVFSVIARVERQADQQNIQQGA